MGGRAAEELIFGKDKITGRNLLDVTVEFVISSVEFVISLSRVCNLSQSSL